MRSYQRPPLFKEEKIQLPYQRFKKSLIDFKEYDGPTPYGQLPKEQFE